MKRTRILNTEEMNFDDYAIAAGQNFHVLLKTIEAYREAGVEPPQSYARYAARQILEAFYLVAWLEDQYPDAAWTESEGAL